MNLNNTSEPSILPVFGDNQGDNRDMWSSFYFFIAPYLIISVIALIGNTLTITTIIYVKKLHSPTYLLLCSLAVSDLFFTLLGPILVRWMFFPGRWFLGSVGCKLVFFFMRFQYAYSVLILVTAAGYRFLAIRYPILYRRRKPQTKRIIALTVTISFAACAPFLYALDTRRENTYVHCYFFNWTEREKEIYHYLMQVLLYVIPLGSMFFLYTATCLKLRERLPGHRSDNQLFIEARRRRMAYLLMALVACFFFCWTPFSCVEIYFLLHPDSDVSTAYFIAMLLVFTSAAINPIIYCFLCNEFRHGLKILTRRARKKIRCFSTTSRKYNLRSSTDDGMFVEEVVTSL